MACAWQPIRIHPPRPHPPFAIPARSNRPLSVHRIYISSPHTLSPSHSTPCPILSIPSCPHQSHLLLSPPFHPSMSVSCARGSRGSMAHWGLLGAKGGLGPWPRACPSLPTCSCRHHSTHPCVHQYTVALIDRFLALGAQGGGDRCRWEHGPLEPSGSQRGPGPWPKACPILFCETSQCCPWVRYL